jgi:hypothetical protein
MLCNAGFKANWGTNAKAIVIKKLEKPAIVQGTFEGSVANF